MRTVQTNDQSGGSLIDSSEHSDSERFFVRKKGEGSNVKRKQKKKQEKKQEKASNYLWTSKNIARV